MSVFADGRRLVCVREAADDAFWDRHWAAQDLRRELEAGAAGSWVSELTRRFLPPGSLVLEGGCGTGRNVAALQGAGYRAVGLDYAEDALRRAREAAPTLDLRSGDVRLLPFADASLDGYWSLGVIEHFYEGHTAIVAEARRVLRPGGFFFLSFPYMSPLRRAKRAAGAYPVWDGAQRETFYQFMLDGRAMRDELERDGFILREQRPFDAVKGLKDETPWLKAPLQGLYDSRRAGARLLKVGLERALRSVSAHCLLLVLERRP